MSDHGKSRHGGHGRPPRTPHTLTAALRDYPHIPVELLKELDSLFSYESPRELGRNLRQLFSFALFPREGLDVQQLDQVSVVWELMEALSAAPEVPSDVDERLHN